MIYRLFEILPGLLTWATLVAMFVFSAYLPAAVAVFIILFDIYWLLKTFYLSFHLRTTFISMRRNLQTDWIAKLDKLKSDTNNPNYIRMSPIAEADDIRTKFARLPAGRDFSGRLNWKDIYHLIILPMVDESADVVLESFESLAKAEYPRDKMLVVLATEERAGEKAQLIARKVRERFGDTFGKFLITAHPKDLPGEIIGKGSNETWATKEAKKIIIDPGGLDYKKILVSVFDVDTQIYPHYFSRLTYVFLNVEHPYRSAYQPIPLFTNNVYQAPALARVVSFSSTFWQMMQQSRPERLTTFSSQSLPFQTLLDIGYWETDMVSEDSRVFWQCFLRYNGDFRVEPLLYPVSMDANAGPTFWQTMANLYRQQRRWAWGAENIPYMLTGFFKNVAISWRKKLYWTFNVIEGFHSWATNSLLIFAMGWLPLFLGGERFGYTLLSHSLPQITRLIIQLSMLGIVTSAIVSILLLPPREKNFRSWHYVFYFLQWALLPATLIVFGAIPAIEAQTRLMLGGKFRLGFWVTPKHRAQISNNQITNF